MIRVEMSAEQLIVLHNALALYRDVQCANFETVLYYSPNGTNAGERPPVLPRDLVMATRLMSLARAAMYPDLDLEEPYHPAFPQVSRKGKIAADMAGRAGNAVRQLELGHPIDPTPPKNQVLPDVPAIKIHQVP